MPRTPKEVSPMLLCARYVIPVTEEFLVSGIENGAVLVRGDTIEEVGPVAELRARHPGEPERDLGNAALLPGFVNCHANLETSIMRGITNDVPYVAWRNFIRRKERLLDDRDWRDSAMMGAYEALRSGVTTVADVTRTGVSFDAIAAFGLRGVVYREVGASSREQVTERMESAATDVESWRARSSECLLTAGIAAESIYTCHPELLGEVARYAASSGVPVCVDIAGSQEEYDFIKYGHAPYAIAPEPGEGEEGDTLSSALLPTGCSPVRYVLNWDILDVPQVLAVHCVKVDESDIYELAQRDVSVAVCSRANAKLGMGAAPVIAMRRAGIAVGLGTGSLAACDSMDPIDEMRFTLLVQRSSAGRAGFITGPDMMRMGTLESACALHMDDKVGSLEPGKLADIVAVDLSHSSQVPTHFPNSAVIHTSDRSDVVMTMVGGKILYDAADHISPVRTVDSRELRRVVNDIKAARTKLRAPLAPGER